MKVYAVILLTVLVTIQVSSAWPAWSWGGGKTTTTVRPSSTTPALPPVNPDGGADFTTAAPAAFRQCVAACPTLPQYNPVCGTNGQTYDNQSKLECARMCGIANLTTVRMGTCAPL